jgi:hypothetical protein
VTAITDLGDKTPRMKAARDKRKIDPPTEADSIKLTQLKLT